ncbi:MAG: dephospho-CoA kinase [bacterium]|nr:dephospho-CoA kinase [bacterium]
MSDSRNDPSRAAARRTQDGRPPIVVGLCGGIGAGKSAVAGVLSGYGAAVIDSDELNRQELESPEVIRMLAAWYGRCICGPDGRILRPVLGRIVFEDPEQRRRVESLLHPRVARRRGELMEQARRDAGVRLIVIDSPLLYETGLDEMCDVVLFVESPEEQRLQRVASARGWDAEELARREKTQQPLDSKSARADHIIVNNSGLDELRVRVEEFLSQLPG